MGRMNFFDILRVVQSLPSIISTVETVLSHGTGAMKKEEVRKSVKAGIDASNLMAGKTIVDQKRFTKGLDRVIDGIVAMLNATAWKKK